MSGTITSNSSFFQDYGVSTTQGVDLQNALALTLSAANSATASASMATAAATAASGYVAGVGAELVAHKGQPNGYIAADASGNPIANGVTLTTSTGSFRVNATTTRQNDHGAAGAFIANHAGGQAGVMGYVPGKTAAYYPTIDSVGLYVENNGRPPLFVVASPTFTVTANGDGTYHSRLSFGTPLAAAQIAQLSASLQILTNHVTPVTGWVSAWDPAGAWVDFVDGFFVLGSPANPAALGLNPAGMAVAGGGTLRVAFGPITKIWGVNANALLSTPGAFTPNQACGFELGTQNSTGGDFDWLGDYSATSRYMWGYDSINFGPNKGSSAFVARGPWQTGYTARAGNVAAFVADQASRFSGTPGDGFVSLASTGYAFAVRQGDVAAAPLYTVSAATGAMSCHGTASVLGGIPGVTAGFATAGITIGWNASNGQGEVDFLLGSNGAGGGLNVYQLAAGAIANPAAPILALSGAGALTVSGGVAAGGAVNAVGSANNAALAGSAAGQPVTLQSFGSDANIGIQIVPKGTGPTTVYGPVTNVQGAIVLGAVTGPTLASGPGAPSAAAPIGSIFLRTDGAAGSCFYVNQTGLAAGWHAVA